MKTVIQPVAVGEGKFEPIRWVRYLEDAMCFEIEFDSGAIGQLDRARLLKANRQEDLSQEVSSIWLDAETRSGFWVRFSDGTIAEASWELVLEEPREQGADA